ncbi:DUF1036 domain-containing protein [Candidatus Liberibacter americanus]|uniref:Putative integral membrane protein n=1 Tax=Candidatus Liberibacter americanus str. Sao Paulo TaxID=1261131 RepID=U6B317_9HYPH|nr:DUF1036 domain-containing protein [Candidatus Liberibacter americanus]AHA27454.1 putative integral membrane protein [Candidatus Liberibacter americanus str. Sao Paulo]EMS36727.1 hypothetical protein G653_00730 [Candidatus Liberibacter americanus PW_SP]
MIRFISIFFSFIAIIFYSDISLANFRVCNETNYLVGISLGQPSIKGGWITKGWWQIPMNTCETILKGDLDSRYYYLYAEGSDNNAHWIGDIQMCVGQDVFTIVGINDCYARGYLKVGFTEYDTGQHASWTVHLTKPSSK